MSESRFDVVVIGGGVGGYVAAIRAAQLGLRTACVERRGVLGGTCLNVGCIPSKALLYSSERFAEARHGLADHGIAIGSVELDLARMMARKDKVVEGLTKGIEFLFSKNGVEWVRGSASIPEPGRVEVAGDDGTTQRLEAQHVVIATGSESMPLAGAPIDEKRIVSSTGALALEAVPERLVVVGAGAIGLELGSVWSRLGAKVAVIEFLDRILPGMDLEIAKQTQRILKRQGLEFRLGTRVASADAGSGAVRLALEPAKGGEKGEKGGEGETLEADVVLVSIGRRPFTAGLGLEALGVLQDERGAVRVDANFRTNVPGLYAIGDCIPGPMLAHKAEDDGIACAERIAGRASQPESGRASQPEYGLVPSVVYTWPEVAGVGKTEEALREAGVEYRVGKFPFSANSRARATGDTDGLVKVIADVRSDRVLGVHAVGPLAGDLLQEAVLAMEFAASAEDIARTCHAHPAMGEALKEAALAVAGRAIHA